MDQTTRSHNKAMDYGRLQRFVARHGPVAVFDAAGTSHQTDSEDSQRLVENASQFLWDELVRSRAEMESLVAQAERGLVPGCADCDSLERELIAAQDRDRREKNLEQQL